MESRVLPGLTPYADAHALQQRLVDERRRDLVPDTVLVLEHDHVLTVGRGRNAEAGVLDAGDLPVVRVERGGETTWHGPGQLVAYPIWKLEGAQRDLHRHLRVLEDAVIHVLADLGVAAGRDPRNTGVWVGGRKICSVGIACRSWVTWHGLALNLDPDPAVWERIRPCGFPADTMTRLADHVPACPSLAELADPLVRALAEAHLPRT